MPRKILLFFCLSLSSGWAAAPLEPQRTLFLQAEQALAQGRPDEARQLAGTLAGYPLHPYLLYEILSRTPASEPELVAFLERYGQTRYAAPLRRQLLQQLAARESWGDYVRHYRETKDVEIQCDYFFALHRLGRDPEASAGAAKLWAAAEPAAAACRRLFAVWTASPGFTPAALWKRFGAALGKDRPALAAELQDLLPAEQRDTAALWLRVHEEPALVERCPLWRPEDPAQGPIFSHGVDRLARKDPWRAQLVWNSRRNDFRIDQDEQARVDRRLGLALAVQRYPQATAYLGAIPDDIADDQIRTWRIRAALWKQDWPVALAALPRLAESEKKKSVWRYWRARTLEALGDLAEAGEIFESLADERDLFGFIAADRRGRNDPLPFTVLPVAEPELQRLRDSEPFRAVEEFRALNRPGEAQKEWMEALESLPRADLPLAARLAQQWDWHRLAILTLVKADQWDDLSVRFPLAFSDPITREARAQRLDPAVIFGIVRRESAFDPFAKSPARALGLMQLLPSTGEQVARQLGENWRTERTLLDPALNVRLGTAYFRGLMDRFGDRLVLASAAYNAGPGRVARWLPKTGPMPADVWIETIPFEETRRYVSAVLGYAAIYRQRLGLGPARIRELLAEIAPEATAEEKPDLPIPVPACRRPAKP